VLSEEFTELNFKQEYDSFIDNLCHEIAKTYVLMTCVCRTPSDFTMNRFVIYKLPTIANNYFHLFYTLTNMLIQLESYEMDYKWLIYYHLPGSICVCYS